MASVTSLDQDMRNLRLSRYTPQSANEAREWIESALGETLPPGDLLQNVLKDGVVLCKLVNLVLPPPGIKFKKSGMPFIQMENISNFLRACSSPPLNMHSHDRFLTVDLYESKDPAQVLQTIMAFSRVAHELNPDRFPTTIGPSKKAGALSPSGSSTLGRNASTNSQNYSTTPSKLSPAVGSARPLSPALTGGSNASNATNSSLKSSSGTVSSWSRKGDQGTTNPAWNIHQYGYMGGASQGNQGVAFGARRQITTAAPHVPSLAEKERKRKEKEAEEARLRLEAEEAERKRRVESDAHEEQERAAEEQKWEQETNRVREEQRKRLEQQKKEWEDQERKWQAEEEARLKEEAEAQKHATKTNPRSRATSDARLTGQFLSQYQAEQAAAQAPLVPPRSPREQEDTPEKRRVRELEKQLEEARERERQYQREREERARQDIHRLTGDSVPRPPSPKDSEASWAPDEREYLQKQWHDSRPSTADSQLGSTRPVGSAGTGSSRPLPQPSSHKLPQEAETDTGMAGARRPLPKPEDYQPSTAPQNRTERFLADNAPPTSPKPVTHRPAEMGYTSTLEEDTDQQRRLASQQKTKAGGWASKSLLEREMERERERQREWEAAQQATSKAPRDTNEGSAEGKTWDVNQYGFTGGDSQNKGSSTGSGIAFGGRRQIIGPRPLP
ncbi:hypothetical protein AAFC00_000985 [Neodothiora populina]|uniref:Calponin-homology (CH) domain-containing protein n=1 Tax=Neodothiora populina TaxID=2781224 RepID=A0ABR3PME5_9PEZI